MMLPEIEAIQSSCINVLLHLTHSISSSPIRLSHLFEQVGRFNHCEYYDQSDSDHSPKAIDYGLFMRLKPSNYTQLSITYFNLHVEKKPQRQWGQ